MTRYKIAPILLLLSLLFGTDIVAQSSKRKVLEARRIQLQKDKVYINALLSNTKRKEKNVLNELKDLKDKIKSRQNVITALSNEFNEMGNEIYLNQLEINKNTRELKSLKKDYGAMIYKSYKSKSQNSRIMFLLSASNFLQAYKRFQYMKQYASFRKNQAEKIQDKTVKLQTLTDSLKIKKDQKQALLAEKKKEQQIIEKDKRNQEGLLSEVKNKESKYKKQIRGFQREEAKIEAQIDKIIRDAIAASNRNSNASSTKSNSSSSAGFALTAEAKALAAEFSQNKGKLPWPVEKGYVSTYYGNQPHPIVKSISIKSNGVRITTGGSSKARAVFNGTVLSVQVMSGNKKMVLIQHGNYITVYKNLINLKVKTGDKVKTKQEIGSVFTDKITGKTILGFVLSKNTKTENPRSWIYRM